jgi:hypothetical protein
MQIYGPMAIGNIPPLVMKTHWKPKGDVSLKLGSKGFFTTIFNQVEDKEQIFQGDPYFFN